MKEPWLTLTAIVTLAGALSACDSDRARTADVRARRPSLGATAEKPTLTAALRSEPGRGPGGQRPLANREAIVPPQCYTRTEGRHNPCYVCHQRAVDGEGHENRMNDGELQGDYDFSDFAATNRWSNLFVDRGEAVRAMSDEAIRRYVAEDNWTPLVERMREDEAFRGWKPDLKNLANPPAAFDTLGFARDGSGWVAFSYMPMPSTFWPTNGSTDDVMIRLPGAFRARAAGGPEVRDVYLANLAILEASIKNEREIGTPLIDEKRVGSDLDGDGVLRRVRRILRGERYVGAAAEVKAETFLYPKGTEFLHSVRYVGVDAKGEIFTPPRLKEARYMVKHTSIPKFALAGIYDDELQEKEEGNPPYYPDFRDKGIDNGFGWRVQGYIEAKDGSLRPNSYEETLFCMGCHSTIGSTIDHTFAFARKVDGAKGWGYLALRGMPDAPSRGERDGQILTYLRRAGGGSEFRSNDEMQRRWFRADGSLDEARVRAARDVHELVAPSAERALLLNKAYRVIVLEQSYLHGRDATLAPPENVFQWVDREDQPLEEEHRYDWDLRVAWPKSAAN